MAIPGQLVKLRTALEEAEHVRGAEWTHAQWILGAVGNLKMRERRCRLAPSDSIDNARRQEVEAVDLEPIQAQVRASRGNARVRRADVADLEARDVCSRARELNIKVWTPHRRTAGYLQERELRKATGRGEKSCRLDICSFVLGFNNFIQGTQLITEGRADDGLNDISGNMAASYIQPLQLAAGERSLSYGIDARRQVRRVATG